MEKGGLSFIGVDQRKHSVTSSFADNHHLQLLASHQPPLPRPLPLLPSPQWCQLRMRACACVCVRVVCVHCLCAVWFFWFSGLRLRTVLPACHISLLSSASSSFLSPSA